MMISSKNKKTPRWLAFVQIGLLVAFLLGCETLGLKRPVSKESLAEINNVGVVSLLTSDFHLIHIGATIYKNTHRIESMPGWNVDEFAKTVLVTELSKSDRYVVGAIKGSFSGKYEDKYEIDYGKIAGAAREQGFDTAVIITPTFSYDNARFHVGGYGFYDRKSLFGAMGRCVYSLFYVQVLDARTEKELAWERGYPCRDGDEDINWRGNLTTYTAEELTIMERRLKERIARNIQNALKNLRFISAVD